MAEGYDAGDPKHVKKRKTKVQLAEEAVQEDLRVVGSTPAGRRFLWRLLAETGIHHSVPQSDHGHMSRSEGKRDIGLEVTAWMHEADPKLYLLMQREAVSRDAKAKEEGN